MIDWAIACFLLHPLIGVALLAGLGATAAGVLVPRLHELNDHGHPRC